MWLYVVDSSMNSIHMICCQGHVSTIQVAVDTANKEDKLLFSHVANTLVGNDGPIQ